MGITYFNLRRSQGKDLFEPVVITLPTGWPFN